VGLVIFQTAFTYRSFDMVPLAGCLGSKANWIVRPRAFKRVSNILMIENSVALFKAAEIYRDGSRGGAQRARPWLPSFRAFGAR